MNPIVEDLFDIDNSIWKHYWYEHLLHKWKGMAIGSLFGINRILLMMGLIKPQINSNKLTDEIINRQVI